MVSDRRSEILSAAADLFAKQGYHPTTVADIARAADVAQGTVYLYFESKKAVFEALVDETLTLFKELLSWSTRLRSDLTLRDLEPNMRHIFGRVLRLFVENRTLVRLMLTEVRGADAQIEAKLEAFYKEVVTEAANHLKQGAAQGLFRTDMDAILVTHFLVALMERCAGLVLRDEHSDVDEMATTLARFVLYGIVARENDI